MKKLETWESYFRDKTDEEIIALHKSAHNSVVNLDCFGRHDLVLYEMAARELEARGYEMEEVTIVEWTKAEDEEDEGDKQDV